MSYKFQYYTPFKKQEKQRARQKKLAHRARKLTTALLVAVGLCAVLLTISGVLGGPLPSWEKLYAAVSANASVAAQSKMPDAVTRIHFIDVGQADATLIEQDGEFCLVDAGGLGSGEQLLDYLDAAGVETIQLIVMTHEHTDHIGAMVDVLEHYDVQQVLLPDFTNAQPPNGYTILRTLELLDVQGVPEVTAKQGDTFAIGTGTLTVLSSGIPTKEKNNTSTVALFTAGKFRYLACGDAQEQQTAVLRENGTNVRANLYKAAHHGASDANGEEWLRAIAPQNVIVSCGRDNSFGHPQPNALRAFDAVNAAVYRTDKSGNVVVSIDAAGKVLVTPEFAANASEDAAQNNAIESETAQRAA